MKKWFGVLVYILVGVGAGFAGAYFVGSLEAVSTGPLLSIGSSEGSDFNQVLGNLAYLGTTEQAAANCGGKSDLQPILTNQAKVVALLLERSSRPGHFIPPMDAAQARLAIRTMIDAERQPDRKLSRDLVERAENLAASAGWRNYSEAHLREIIVALNKDHCEQLSTAGERAQ